MLKTTNVLRVVGNSLCRRTLMTRRPRSTNHMSPLVNTHIQRWTPISQSLRYYSDHGGLTKEDVQKRILSVLETFDKVKDPAKLKPTADFERDLGLDSLDVVEVLCFVEEEFSILIPDHEAEEIHTIAEATEYILAQSDAI